MALTNADDGDAGCMEQRRRGEEEGENEGVEREDDVRGDEALVVYNLARAWPTRPERARCCAWLGMSERVRMRVDMAKG